MDKLSLDHRNFVHVSVDPCAQRHDVAIHLGVVCTFVNERIANEISASEQKC